MSVSKQRKRTGVVNRPQLNLRAGPSGEDSVIGNLSNGASVEILERSDDWYRVRSGDLEGFVQGDFIDFPSSNLSSEVNQENVKTERFEISPTVMSARDKFSDGRRISAAEFVQEILKSHSEYAKGKTSSLKLEKIEVTRPAIEWLADVQSLFDADRMTQLSTAEKPPVLHGRLVVIGLCLLDGQLRRQVSRDGVFKELVKELNEPLEEILTQRGQVLYETPDSVPNQPDDPLESIEADQLGRAAFARYLAERIVALNAKGGSFSIHIYGPWGSGKSTLLNFLRETLKKKSWLVVEFNAWRNQHIRLPWWTLMETVFDQTKQELKQRHRLFEIFWRFCSGRLVPLISLSVCALWIIALVVAPWLRGSSETGSSLHAVAEQLDDVGKILAIVGTVWGLVIAYNRSLLFGSSKAAENYLDSIRDPMNEIKLRFERFVNRLLPKRLIIFIDDLDRCQTTYVIELLEGIQTLFRSAPVVFVVAADRKWLNACYEEVYAKLTDSVNAPGKSLGELFLEKVFQFSASVPGIPNDLKEFYWHNLIGIGAAETRQKLAEARVRAQELVKENKTEGSLLRAVSRSRDKTEIEQRAIREQAAIRLASPEVIERTEHNLKPFADLLELNPRAMKRLVNAYSVNRVTALLSRVDVELEHLALWTILSLRWPSLAEYLVEYPEAIYRVGQAGIVDGEARDELKHLMSDPDVVRVVSGGASGMRLNADVIKSCGQLRGY